MVEDVIVKAEDCYYPVDFLVVDYVGYDDDTQPTVILGRPFLATTNAIINCAIGTVSIKFGDRELILNVFPKFTNPLDEDKCPEEDISPNRKNMCYAGAQDLRGEGGRPTPRPFWSIVLYMYVSYRIL
ncbi:putative aspartic peptidase domain superfamily [Helianthus debilis subsp. tardiflorus]